MKKTPSSKSQIDQDMASECRFDYEKAKPNRFANLNVGWTVEKFVEEERKKVERSLRRRRRPLK